MARPSSSTPGPVIVLPGLSGPTVITDEPTGSQPADLNQSWRSLMQALGVNLPYHLNRAVAVVNRGHAWAK